jgi:hypothetical protein
MDWMSTKRMVGEGKVGIKDILKGRPGPSTKNPIREYICPPSPLSPLPFLTFLAPFSPTFSTRIFYRVFLRGFSTPIFYKNFPYQFSTSETSDRFSIQR